eukprot:scaffold109942_cov60-Phaeocystis_antarctica.AAC.1
MLAPCWHRSGRKFGDARSLVGMAPPPLDLGSSSVTVLRSGPDFVVAAGLCGWLRAWQLRPAEQTSEEVSEEAWVLVLDEHSTYDLPNGRTSSHPFRCVAVADGELAASTTHAEGHIQVWDTKRWVRTQLLQAVEAESGERARFVKHAARATTSCLALDGSTLVAGSREGCVNSWR